MNKRDDHQEGQSRAKKMHQICTQHMYYHVMAKTNDGQQVEGIITDLDNKNVYMLVSQDMMPSDEELQGSPQGSQQMTQQGGQQQGQRQWDGGRPHYRRFFRQIFPLISLAALSLYPYYYPPYPYYPYPYPYPYLY